MVAIQEQVIPPLNYQLWKAYDQTIGNNINIMPIVPLQKSG